MLEKKEFEIPSEKFKKGATVYTDSDTPVKEVGIRVPDNSIARGLVEGLGNPLLTMSVHDEDEIIEYSTDPELIHEKYEGRVALVIDGGYGGSEASTVVDCVDDAFEIVRQGKGELLF